MVFESRSRNPRPSSSPRFFRPVRVAVVGLPLLFVPQLLGDPSGALRAWFPPEPHSVDLEGRHTNGFDFDGVAAKRAVRDLLNNPPAPEVLRAPVGANDTSGLNGFMIVGSVAVLAAEPSMITRKDTGWGITPFENLANLATRFVEAFGDDYDQLAVFLAFPDRLSPNALAYQQGVTNDVRGIGLGLFNHSARFGSKGRLQTVLNMKRINLYGRDAAGDPDNGLYPVWAQEAAHRWLVHFTYQRAGDAKPNDGLLGRQNAHWSRGVEAQGSILEGYDWKDNGDGTFTPGKRNFRYGILDQYGMGLRKAAEVPKFYLLENLTDEAGTAIPAGPLGAAGRFRGTKIDLGIEDIIRAVGPRDPEIDAVAQELRMGVILLGLPGDDIGNLVGEAFQIDNTRSRWTMFYNTAGGGRGRVCTNLLRPCRGPAFAFGTATLDEGPGAATADGVPGRGEPFVLSVEITNTGDEPGPAAIVATAPGLTFSPLAAPPIIAAGETRVVPLQGRVAANVTCGQPITVDLRIAVGKAPSRDFRDVVVGLAPKVVESFEGAAAPAGWRVNPAGTDSGEAGRWAWGKPMRAVAFDYTLQPGAAFSGEGAFATGLSSMEIDNVEGRTTLESPGLPVAGLVAPILSYQVYFVAAEFSQEVLVPSPTGVLLVQASIDGGATYIEVDRMTGMATGWRRRVIPLTGKLGAALAGAKDVKLRFVAEENTQSVRPVIEAAIDEVGIFEPTTECRAEVVPPEPTGGTDGGVVVDGGVANANGDEGCGCRVGASRRAGGGGVAGLAGLMLLAGFGCALGRRRARRRHTSATIERQPERPQGNLATSRGSAPSLCGRS